MLLRASTGCRLGYTTQLPASAWRCSTTRARPLGMRSSSARVLWFGKETKVIRILRNKLRPHLALLAVLAVYLAVTLAYGVLNPIGEAPDEVAHIRLIQFISQQGHLPLNQAERLSAGYKSDSPMLYHALIGLVTRWVDYDSLPRVKVSVASPRYLLI